MANVNYAIGAVAVVDKWVEYASRANQNLCCANPRCVHLFEHVVEGDDNVSFKDLGCETTVDVNLNGKLEKRYRFGSTDTIHLGTRSVVCPTTNKLEVDSASIVCGACMAVGAHIGRGGLCRASLAEAPDNADQSTLPRADPHGPRITALEQHNTNSYNEADALEKIRQEALSNANANPNRGGAAVQRALLEDRKAELTSATKTANAAKKAHSRAKTHLAQMEQGYDKNQDPHEHLDLEDEDDAAAAKFYLDNGKNVGLLREHFPLCALYWYGWPPTDEAIAEGKSQVDSTREAWSKTAVDRDAAALAVTEAETMLAELGQDYDDGAEVVAGPNAANPDAAANKRGFPKKGGAKYKGKTYEEMSDEEKRAFDERNVASKEKRKKKASEDRLRIENYPRVYKKAVKYQRAVEEKKISNQARVFQDRVQSDWLTARKGKPNGWDPEAMLADFNKYCRKRRREEDDRQEEEKNARQAVEPDPEPEGEEEEEEEEEGEEEEEQE